MSLYGFIEMSELNVVVLCQLNYNAWQAGLKIKNERPVFQTRLPDGGQVIFIEFIIFKKLLVILHFS